MDNEYAEMLAINQEVSIKGRQFKELHARLVHNCDEPNLTVKLNQIRIDIEELRLAIETTLSRWSLP